MSSTPALDFISLNPTSPRTLLLIHGAFSSRHEWTLVASHLPQYHLLIANLPSHGRSTSREIPFSIPTAAALLASLITSHAHNGRADVVGLSLGGYTALYLASRYPDLVDNIFMSGCHQTWDGKWNAWLVGHFMSCTTGFVLSLPKTFFMWLCGTVGMSVSDELWQEMVASYQYQLGLDVMKSIGADCVRETWEKVAARSLLVVGSGEPMSGQVVEKEIWLKKGNSRSRGFKISSAVHGWNLQRPDLFAEGIVSWMEEKDLPEEFMAVGE